MTQTLSLSLMTIQVQSALDGVSIPIFTDTFTCPQGSTYLLTDYLNYSVSFCTLIHLSSTPRVFHTRMTSFGDDLTTKLHSLCLVLIVIGEDVCLLVLLLLLLLLLSLCHVLNQVGLVDGVAQSLLAAHRVPCTVWQAGQNNSTFQLL